MRAAPSAAPRDPGNTPASSLMESATHRIAECEASAERFAAISRDATTFSVTHTTVWNFGQTTLLITTPSSPVRTRGLVGGPDCRRHMGCGQFGGGRTPFRKSP